MLRVCVLLVCASAVFAAPVPKGIKAKLTVDGKWEAVLLKSSGNDFTKSSPWLWEISGETVTRYRPQADGSVLPDGTATFTRPDPTHPDEVDYTLPNGGGAGTLFRARVEIQDGELVINFANVNADRPPDMTELKDGYYYRFKRVKE